MTDAEDIPVEPAETAGQNSEPEVTEPSHPDEPISESRWRRWRGRPSVRDLKRQTMEAHELQPQWDRIENDRTRLADGEEVHLGGIVLADAFTPATVSSLRKAIEDSPWSQNNKDRWLARLDKGRSAAGASGSVSTAVIRGNSSPFGQKAPALPDEIDVVWLHLLFPTPSLTVIVATFTLSDKAGGLSDCLRADYHTEMTDFRLTAAGKFGRVHGRIPWARPRYWTSTSTPQMAAEQKRLACESRMKKHEADCRAWLAERFPGRFSADRQMSRPVVRLLLTKAAVPFSSDGGWMEPVGLSSGLTVWRSINPPGWFLKEGDWPRDRRFFLTAAARRQDVARDHGADTNGETNWYLTRDFARAQSFLVAKWVASCLLSLYADLLADLRDRAGKRRRLPVRQAGDLNSYLIGDGLDVSTITGDIEEFTADLQRFRWNTAEYVEHNLSQPFIGRQPAATEEQSADPPPADEDEASSKPPQATGEPAELVHSLRDLLRRQASRLSQDTELTTGNVRASAELRQAIANTRLQRVLMGLTALALAVSLWVAFHPESEAQAPPLQHQRGTPSPSAHVRTSPAR